MIASVARLNIIMWLHTYVQNIIFAGLIKLSSFILFAYVFHSKAYL